MQEKDFYYTIEKSAVAEFKDRGSKFIAYAYSVNTIEACKEKLAEIKKGHPKATHHCFAYRLGLNDDLFRVNDDGEPSGTAGRPILGQIDSRQLTNIMIIVVRYFGGTLLGVPGLINAYKSSAALVLQLTPPVKKIIEKKYLLQFDYTKLNDIMKLVKQFDCRVISQDIQLFCEMTVGAPKNKIDALRDKLGEWKEIEWRELHAE